MKLVSESEDDVEIDFDESALIRGDTLSTYDALGKLHQAGLATRNECRAKANLNPVDGGDMFLIPKNCMPVGQNDSVEEQQKFILSKPATPEQPKDDQGEVEDADEATSKGEATGAEKPATDEPVQEGRSNLGALAASLRKLLDEVVARFVHVEQEKATREAKKPASYRQWVSTFTTTHRSRVAADLRPIIEMFVTAASRSGSPSPQLVDSCVNAAVEKYISDLQSDLAEIDGLQQRMDGWKEYRVAAFSKWAVDELVERMSHEE